MVPMRMSTLRNSSKVICSLVIVLPPRLDDCPVGAGDYSVIGRPAQGHAKRGHPMGDPFRNHRPGRQAPGSG
jgi:hypothetical protein